ncbi:hypothetical protein RUND412_000828 [Rhizina undulata]
MLAHKAAAKEDIVAAVVLDVMYTRPEAAWAGQTEREVVIAAGKRSRNVGTTFPPR